MSSREAESLLLGEEGDDPGGGLAEVRDAVESDTRARIYAEEQRDPEQERIEKQRLLGYDPYDTSCSLWGFISSLCITLCHVCAPKCILEGEHPKLLKEYYAVCDNWHLYSDEERATWHTLCRSRIKCKTPAVVRWAELYAELETGDLVLFRCSDTYGSSLVTEFTGEWSHVGMVVILYGEPNSHTGRRKKYILLWESVSHSDDLVDFATNEPTSGVRLVDLKRRLLSSPSHYYGIVKFRHVSEERREAITENFRIVHDSSRNLPYDSNKLNLCRVAYVHLFFYLFFKFAISFAYPSIIFLSVSGRRTPIPLWMLLAAICSIYF